MKASMNAPSVASTITMDGEDYVLTFNDEFNGSTAAFWKGHGSRGVWSTSYSPHLDDARSNVANNELQYYADPDMAGLPGTFSVGGGVLTIHASQLDASQQALAEGQLYSSGMIATEMSFHMNHGYIELSADIPDQTGLWSAFWLLPADGDWSAEIDVFEFLGEDADRLHTNVWNDGTPNAEAIATVGAGDGFHTYGLYWDADVIRWYYDGAMIREEVNTVDEEMYLLFNLAVGGWADDPDAGTDFSDGLSIDYIRVYELASGLDRNDAIQDGGYVPTEYHAGTPGDDVIQGSRWGDLVEAGTGNDSVYGDDGDDRLSGGAGADTLYGNAGDDVLDGGAGRDNLVGGQGADTLDGGSGTDHLWGGSYGADGTADVFVFRSGGGTDYVHDFEDGIDLIALSGFVAGWEQLSGAITDQGWASYLNLAAAGGQAGDGLYLVGVSTALLDESDFIFGAVT